MKRQEIKILFIYIIEETIQTKKLQLNMNLLNQKPQLLKLLKKRQNKMIILTYWLKKKKMMIEMLKNSN